MASMMADDFFQAYGQSRHLYEAIAGQIEAIGQASIHVSKSQIAFKRKCNVAVL